MICLKDFVKTVDKFVVAHRGSSGTAPENTMAAIREALRANARMIELDVQFTADNQAVLLHDNALGRTTASSGRLSAFKYEQLRELDAGSWFHPNFHDERIPLLSEAIALLKGAAYLNIEIKPPRRNEDYEARIDSIFQIVYDEGMIPYTLFASFHHSALRELKRRYPEIHIAAINLPGDKRLPSAIAQETLCEGIVYGLRELTFEKMRDAEKSGIYTGAYVINTEEELNRALRYGVRAIASNFPAKITNLLQGRSRENNNAV